MLTIAYQTIAMPGERENGDGVVVREGETTTMVAVIDGLGHGAKAARATRCAVELLTEFDIERPIEHVMSALDDAMRGTRGAAATVCIVRQRELEGCGVGNVEWRGRRTDVPVVLSPGILGGRVRTFRYFRGALGPGSRFVMYSDGLTGRFALQDFDGRSAKQTCDTLMEQYSKRQDDATVLVADMEDVANA